MTPNDELTLVFTAKELVIMKQAVAYLRGELAKSLIGKFRGRKQIAFSEVLHVLGSAINRSLREE